VETDPADRPSRQGWPLRTQETTTSAGTHDHRLPQGIFRVLIALSVFLIVLAVVDAVLVIYIVGRGEYRQQQIERTRQEIRDSWCQALDGFPQDSVFLNPLREKYHCGPGIPLDQLPPEIQNQLRPTPAPSTATMVPAQPSVEPSVPSAPLGEAPAPESPEPPAGATGTMGRPEPPPLSPPSQIRELLCDVLGVTCPTDA
jgi:hypothetical protein